jgi:hypothetical protein
VSYECVYEDGKEEVWIIGEWQYVKDLATGFGKWAHLSEFNQDTCEWIDGSVFGEGA